jgi:hypothetical protein
MGETVESTIYDRIYSMLRAQGIEKIPMHKFYAMVRDLRISVNNGFATNLLDLLLSHGLTETKARKVVRDIAYIRFSNDDAYEIQQEMARRGLIAKRSTWQIVVIPPPDRRF